MTHVTFLYDGNLVIGYRLKGHARFNVNGPDIVCSALSSTSQMILNGIIDWTGLSLDDVLKDFNEKEGILEVELEKPFYENVTIQHLFKTLMLFIEQLEIQYDEYITIERRQKE